MSNKGYKQFKQGLSALAMVLIIVSSTAYGQAPASTNIYRLLSEGTPVRQQMNGVESAINAPNALKNQSAVLQLIYAILYDVDADPLEVNNLLAEVVSSGKFDADNLAELIDLANEFVAENFPSGLPAGATPIPGVAGVPSTGGLVTTTVVPLDIVPQIQAAMAHDQLAERIAAINAIGASSVGNLYTPESQNAYGQALVTLHNEVRDAQNTLAYVLDASEQLPVLTPEQQTFVGTLTLGTVTPTAPAAVELALPVEAVAESVATEEVAAPTLTKAQKNKIHKQIKALRAKLKTAKGAQRKKIQQRIKKLQAKLKGAEAAAPAKAKKAKGKRKKVQQLKAKIKTAKGAQKKKLQRQLKKLQGAKKDKAGKKGKAGKKAKAGKSNKQKIKRLRAQLKTAKGAAKKRLQQRIKKLQQQAQEADVAAEAAA